MQSERRDRVLHLTSCANVEAHSETRDKSSRESDSKVKKALVQFSKESRV